MVPFMYYTVCSGSQIRGCVHKIDCKSVMILDSREKHSLMQIIIYNIRLYNPCNPILGYHFPYLLLLTSTESNTKFSFHHLVETGQIRQMLNTDRLTSLKTIDKIILYYTIYKVQENTRQEIINIFSWINIHFDDHSMAIENVKSSKFKRYFIQKSNTQTSQCKMIK